MPFLPILMSWKLWAGVVVAVFLAGTHWKAYKSGGRSVQMAFDMYIIEQKENMLAASEQARLREKSINNSLRESYDNYLVLKKRNSTVVTANTGSLQQLETTIANRPDPSPTTTSGTDGATYRELFQSCARTLTSMAEEADGIAIKLLGLQEYIKATR